MKISLHKPRSALRELLQKEASGGLLLMAASFVALLWANSASSASYFEMLHRSVGNVTVHHGINDGLMALFFLLVGLEIKREFVDGHLSTWADRRLPIIAALAGMIVPALIFLLVAGGDSRLVRGWAIPSATDIAFALAVLTVLSSRAPASLKLFLTTVAIVDDMGAVAIIAFAYTSAISGLWLLASFLTLSALYTANRAGVKQVRWYLAGFAILWFCVLQSGVHATVAGVLAAMTVPVQISPAAPDAENSTLHRLESLLQKPVAWAIVPLFGLANAGVTFGGVSVWQPLPLAIALGLFLGKQVGIFGSVWLSVRLGLAAIPRGASWLQIYGVALLCGIGFTMSLFIGTLAFDAPAQVSAVKIGVLAGSLASAFTGWLILRFAPAKLID